MATLRSRNWRRARSVQMLRSTSMRRSILLPHRTLGCTNPYSTLLPGFSLKHVWNLPGAPSWRSYGGFPQLSSVIYLMTVDNPVVRFGIPQLHFRTILPNGRWASQYSFLDRPQRLLARHRQCLSDGSRVFQPLLLGR